MLAFGILSFSLTTFAANPENKHHLKIFDFNINYPSNCDESTEKCYTVPNMVKKALSSSMESLEEVQVLYQAIAAVKIKMGQILPQLNLTSAATAGIDMSASIDTAVPLAGALFPNRWFDWAAARSLRRAEEQIFNTVLVNRAQTIQDIYFDIQLQIWSIRVLEFYIQEIEKLIEFLQTKRSSGPNSASKECIAVLENMKGKLMFDRAFIDALSAVLPQIATAMGFDPSFDWYHLKIEPQDMGSLRHETRKQYHDFWPTALEQSTEVKSMEHIIEAAKKSKRIPYFDFADPDSSNNLTFATGSRIKSARSNVKMLDIQLQRTKMQLSIAIQNALNNYNDAVESFPGVENGLTKLEDIRSSVEDHINDTTVPIDINKITRHFKYARTQALCYIASYFLFRTAEADLNRYTWRGEIYDIVKDYIALEVPQVIKEARKSFSFRYAFWKKIKAIKHRF